jgi:hypothetical protein
MKTIAITTLLLILSGCSTIKFVQYEQAGEHKTTKHWHHATLNGLVELSQPLDIRQVCGNKAWTNITTERTFANILVGIFAPNTRYVAFYVPWTNKVECFEAVVEEGL